MHHLGPRWAERVGTARGRFSATYVVEGYIAVIGGGKETSDSLSR